MLSIFKKFKLKAECNKCGSNKVEIKIRSVPYVRENETGVDVSWYIVCHDCKETESNLG